MPQMSPMWWTLILMFSSAMTTQIFSNLEFSKEKKKKKKKSSNTLKHKISW
uniref:ATP synthase F0 subunit 8 n=1 Tax=Augilina triaina TaxID=2886257 RepID=UPI001E8026A0|nr:ATP synthase F0 subunit 8 [Augilina triaina]UDL72074.1 ATP synthase F0 subunit 8 [Augilina triaina]